MKLQQTNLEDELFKFKLNILFGGNRESIELWIKENCPALPADNYSGEVTGYFIPSPDDNVYALWVKNPRDIFVLAHECLHLALFVLEIKQIPINKENEELIAYYQEWWIKKIKRVIISSRSPQ